MSYRAFSYLFAVVVAIVSAIMIARRDQPQSSDVDASRGRNNTVLILSNADYGLANALLATSHALLLEHPDIDLHYGSSEKFKSPIENISKLATKSLPDVKPLTFHQLDGPSITEVLESKGLNYLTIMGKPGMWGSDNIFKTIQDYLLPWSGAQYLGLYKEVLKLIEDIDPAVIVMEPLFSPGLDAARASGRRYALVSPNALKDNFSDKQPWLGVLWKYPAPASGYPYPIPWHLVPTNIWQMLRWGFAVLRTPRIAEKIKYLKRNGIQNPSKAFFSDQKDVPWLSQGSLSADFPLDFLPNNVVQCGPIYQSSAPASQQDPELAAWMAKTPTVLVNLGSHMTYTETGATEMARALRQVINRYDVQVIWKFKKRSEYSDAFLLEVQDELATGRLRLEKWINADPAALLETGNIVLFVHHGGSNCYHEAIGTGTPQLVLPMWVDCYEFATRCEYLGIGVRGNSKSAPDWKAEELAVAFSRVLGDGDEAKGIRRKAADLAKRYQEKPGRSIAAGFIADMARGIAI